MDRCKRSQCWLLLKRLMIHPDGAVFKKLFSPKVLDLMTIQSLLLKGLYCRTQEFAEDIRATFSHAMESNPPRHELHKAARGLSRIFELNWKSLEEKWATEKGECKKNSKLPAFSQEKKTQKAKDEGCRDSMHFDNLSKTDSAEGFVKKRKHDSFRDSQCFDDAAKSQYREKQRLCLGLSGSKTDSTNLSMNTSRRDYLRLKFQSQAYSTRSASHHVFTMEEKWDGENGEGKKKSEVTLFSREKTRKSKDEGCSDSHHFDDSSNTDTTKGFVKKRKHHSSRDDSSKTDSTKGFVKKRKHDGFRDPQHFDDATQSQYRPEMHRSYLGLSGSKTDSTEGSVSAPSGDYLLPKIQGQAHSIHSASHVSAMVISDSKLEAEEAFDDSSRTDSTKGFVTKRKHDGFSDPQHFDDATKSQYRPEKHRSYMGLSGSKTVSTEGSASAPSSDYLRPKIHGQAHSTHSASHVCTMVISESKLEAKEAFDDSCKTDSTEGFGKNCKHDSFGDSQHFDNDTEPQYNPEKHRLYLGLSGSKTDSTDGPVNTPSGDYLRPKIQGQAHSTYFASHVCTTVISDSKLEAKEASPNIADTKPKCSFLDTLLAAQKSLFNFCKASSQKKQEEKEARIKAAEIKKEREASRQRLQEMEKSADIEDNLQICEELDQLCGYTLKYYNLKAFGLNLKKDWDC